MAARSTLTVTSGTTITSAWGNSVRDHAVPYTTSNDVTTEGMLAVNTSTDQLVVYTGSTARELARYGAITAFSAMSVSQGGAQPVTIATGSGYSRSGPWIDAIINLTFAGAAGSAGVAITVSSSDLPNPPATCVVGSFVYLDSGTAVYSGVVDMTSAGVMSMQAHNLGAYVGQSPSFALAAADTLKFNIRYAVT